MSGISRFKINCYSPSGLTVANYAQSWFKQTWDFFKQLEGLGYTTEIARNNGSGGTGTDFYDGANPFGPNAWALFRFNAPTLLRSFPYYVLFQYASASGTFGNSPGNPGLFRGTSLSSNAATLGFQMAVAFDSGGNAANPWGGTTGSLGSDTKGSPVWVAPVGGYVDVFPISNNPGNTHATNKENMLGYTSTATTVSYLDFVADADSFFVSFNRNLSATDEGVIGGGYYIPHTGALQTKNRLFLFQTQSQAFIDRSNTWGTTAGTSTTREGGCGRRQGDYGKALNFDWDTCLEKAYPNIYTNPPNKYAVYPLALGSDLSHVGYGDPDFWRATYGLIPKDTNLTKTKMVFGNSVTAGTVKLLLPWDGTTDRGIGTDRNGVVS